MEIGILAMQGDFKEHGRTIKRCEVNVSEIKTIQDLESIDGLIIPGGESTTIGKLLEKSGIGDKIIELHMKGLPIYGTCAGAVLLTKDIIESDQYSLGLMDISVERNAYGSQAQSFEKDIKIDVLGKKLYRCVFIRAPVIKKVSEDVEIMAKENNNIIMARQKKLLVTTFHPELTYDLRIHNYFINEIVK